MTDYNSYTNAFFFPAIHIEVNKYSHKQKNILQISHAIKGGLKTA